MEAQDNKGEREDAEFPDPEIVSIEGHDGKDDRIDLRSI